MSLRRISSRSGPMQFSVGVTDTDVLVWSVGLDVDEGLAAALATSLSPDECARARRFRRGREGRRFAVARGCLRLGLAHQLGVPPSRLRFGYGPSGKPYLRGPRSHRRLQFNVAHAGGVAVYACAADRAVGIDLERVRHLPDLDRVAERFFSPCERHVLSALPSQERCAAFYRCWTRKEAYLKAVGSGLERPLDAFDVAFGEGEPPRLLRVAGRDWEVARWGMASVALREGYAAALVAEGHDWDVVRVGGTR